MNFYSTLTLITLTCRRTILAIGLTLTAALLAATVLNRATAKTAPTSPAAVFAFGPQTTFGLGGTGDPQDVTEADFNLDGKPDLAVCHNSLSNVTILLGNGLGGFGAAVNYPVGQSASGVAVGDFNLDGKPDFVAANSNVGGPNGLTLRLGNGLGGFGAATTISLPTPSSPFDVVVADFNLDGKPDLATANSSTNNISVLLGDGLGGFGAATNFAVVGLLPTSLAVGDFNLDGKPDLASSNAVSDNISVLLGNGLGGFSAAVNYPAGDYAESITTGDLNLDGKPDLAASNRLANTVSVFLGNGLGAFAAATTFPVGTLPEQVRIGDFNLDGKPDLVTANAQSDNASVLLGDGLGGFAAAVNFPFGDRAYSVAVADFNLDGKPDLAVANNSDGDLGVRLNRTNVNPPVISDAGVSGRQGSSPENMVITSVFDVESGPGGVTVTVTSANPSNGVTISNIVNTNGVVTADVSSACNATNAGFTLTANDGEGLTATATLTVNILPNVQPTLDYNNASIVAGTSGTVTPTGSPSDNGSISTIVIQSVTPSTAPATLTVNNTTGVVSVPNDIPAGNYAVLIRATDNCGLTRDAGFNLFVSNTAPTFTPAAAITRQQGSPAGAAATVGTVVDAQTAAGLLVVTQIAGGTATGITVTGITNTNGTITAVVSADCTATSGTVRFQVSDGSLTGAGDLIVNITANSAPTLTYPASDVAMNAATTVSPTTATDNGSITGYQIVSVTPPLTVAPTINASGVISVSNAGPFGSHAVTVRATDNCGATTDVTFTLNVGCGTITLPTIINGLTFVPYNFTFTATGGSGSYAFTLTSGALPSGLSLNGNILSGTPNTAGASTFTLRATDANGCFGERNYTLLIGSTGLKYYPLARPVRLLDTRPGLSPNACFQPNAPIPGNTARLQPARGVCEGLTIPANATTITGNITTVESGGGFLTIYPSDAPQPLVANSNYQPNEILNNAFTVGVGAKDGAVKIFVTSTTDVVVDVTGYYAPPEAGGLYFHPLPRPVRLLETRAGFTGCFAPGQPLPGGVNTPQLGTGNCQGLTIPSDALALVGNATTVNPVSGGYLTLYSANATQPLIASSNYAAGQVVNGPFTVGLSPSGQFNIFTLKTTDLVVDITGYYSAQANDANGAGLLFTSLGSPLRLLDTRAGEQGCYTPGAPMTTGTVYTQETQSPCTNLTPTARALIGNATVVNTTAEGYLTFWPADATQPLVATSNYVAGQVFNRYFTVGLSGSASFKRFASRTTDLVIDISGFFAP